MKKVFLFGLAVMMFAFSGCGKSNSKTEAPSPATETIPSSQEQAPQNTSADPRDTTDGSTLVVYFSCTGNTRGIAEKIADVTGGDFFEIIPAQEYTTDDLNYNDKNSRSTKEQDDASARPEISNTVENWDAYSTVYIGYPIWWYEEPRIMDTFVESYDFTGKNVIPFCTSGGSGIGRSDDNLISNAKGSGNWLEGTRLKSSSSPGDISEWISSLNME